MINLFDLSWFDWLVLEGGRTFPYPYGHEPVGEVAPAPPVIHWHWPL